MAQITLDLGFDYFALAHHIDVRSNGPYSGQLLKYGHIAVTNYPAEWQATYIAENLVNLDPVLLAAQQTNIGFLWEHMDRLITLTPQHRKILERARDLGIGDGYTVPANVPGESFGSCNFAVTPSRKIDLDMIPMAQLFGSFAFNAARQLAKRTLEKRSVGPVRLTERQLQCIALLARGKTDWEIAQLLGISEQTVKQHITEARSRYGVSKRVQLVTWVLFDGALPLSQLIG